MPETDASELEADANEQERAALGILCTNLTDLQQAAIDGGWRSKLDAVIASVRNGNPALRACGYLSLEVDTTQTLRLSTPAMLDDMGIDRLQVAGDYTCPHGSCTRSAQADGNGYEPLCVDGTPMQFTPQS